MDKGTPQSHRHPAEDEWARFARGGMEAGVRERMEDMLAVCEECLGRFMQAVERSEENGGGFVAPGGGLSQEEGASAEPAAAAGQPMPMPDMRQIEDRVVLHLLLERQRNEGREGGKPDRRRPHAEERRRDWLRHPVTHYAVAACVTLLLLGSGALAGMSAKLSELDRSGELRLACCEAQEETAWPGRDDSCSRRLMSEAGGWLDELRDARFNYK